MRRGRIAGLWASVPALLCASVVVGCGPTTAEESSAPFDSPPQDCAQVQAVGHDEVSRFAGPLFDPKLEFRSERPERESAKVLTCYGAYTADGQNPPSSTEPRASTVYITITVTQPDAFSGGDVVDDTKRSFASFRDQHVTAPKIVNGLGDEAYSSKEATDADTHATVDVRIGNATLHVRLNNTYPQTPTPQQALDVETSALALARALAAGIDGFM